MGKIIVITGAGGGLTETADFAILGMSVQESTAFL